MDSVSNPADNLTGTVRRNEAGTMLAVLWPSPPHAPRWMVTDLHGSCGYETDDAVSSWPVVGAVPFSPAAGVQLNAHGSKQPSTVRPELGKPVVGDPVIVHRYKINNRDTKNLEINAVVTKVARLFVTLAETDPVGLRPRVWKMRMSTQQEDSQYSHVDRFVTPDQHAWDYRLSTASAYLREAGIDINAYKVPHGDRAAFTLKVANALRAADGLELL